MAMTAASASVGIARCLASCTAFDVLATGRVMSATGERTLVFDSNMSPSIMKLS